MSKKKAHKIYVTDETWEYWKQYVFGKELGNVSIWVASQAEAATTRKRLTDAQVIKIQIAYGVDTCELVNRLALTQRAKKGH